MSTAPQFIRPGVPLFKAPNIPAMDPDCCCGPPSPDPCDCDITQYHTTMIARLNKPAIINCGTLTLEEKFCHAECSTFWGLPPWSINLGDNTLCNLVNNISDWRWGFGFGWNIFVDSHGRFWNVGGLVVFVGAYKFTPNGDGTYIATATSTYHAVVYTLGVIQGIGIPWSAIHQVDLGRCDCLEEELTIPFSSFDSFIAVLDTYRDGGVPNTCEGVWTSLTLIRNPDDC